jgi:hypothetical protein
MTSNTIFFTMTLAALFALPLSAGEHQQEPVPTAGSSGQIDLILDEDIESVNVSKEQSSENSSKPAPQGGNLRARDIGDAFKNFQPSEELKINPNKPVAFPVDI